MFKYRQEHRQKMTQHILSQEFRANTLTPALKIKTPFDLMWREGKPLVPTGLAVVRSGHSMVMPSLHRCI